MHKTPQKKLTSAELTVADRINRTWQRRKKILGSQTVAAHRIGISQGLFSAYINGSKPIGVKTALKFAKLLNVKVTELAPEILADLVQPMQTIETEGISYMPDEKDHIIAGLSRQLSVIAKDDALYPPHGNNREDIENWNRIIDAISLLDSPDLAYFADIIEHRLSLQDREDTNTGMRDLGKITSGSKLSKSGKKAPALTVVRPTRKPDQ